MAQIKTLIDQHGVIYEACKILPDDKHRVKFLEALGELEDNNCYVARSWPKTRLHRIESIKQTVYRAYIDKISGWRIHLQLIDGNLYLRDVIAGQLHDEASEVIKRKKIRYK
jgi:hypothetical protein